MPVEFDCGRIRIAIEYDGDTIEMAPESTSPSRTFATGGCGSIPTEPVSVGLGLVISLWQCSVCIMAAKAGFS